MATVTVYHNLTQAIDLQWAASRDGIEWWRPDRRPALPNPPLGDYSGGMIWPASSPVIERGQLHVYYRGLEGNHGEIFNTKASGPRKLRTRGEIISRQSSALPDHGAACRASWTADRLWALVSAGGGPLEGTATTAPLSLGNKRLLVNVVTRKRGDLRVELLDRAGGVFPGLS